VRVGVIDIPWGTFVNGVSAGAVVLRGFVR
jgi:uncharacterized membrane protein